jgi:hypothetical protein
MKYCILLLAIFFISCGPTSKLKRAERLIAKAEEQGAEWHSDTLYTTVEIPVPEIQTDTVFESTEGDTVLITKDRLEIKYIHLPGQKVYIEGKCKGDTVYREVATTVYKEIKCPEKPQKWKWWHLILAGLVGAGIIALVKR